MPIYTWRVCRVERDPTDEPSSERDVKDKTEVQVIRTVDDIDIPPKRDEYPPWCDENTKWERVICSAGKFRRGPNWRGAKGNW